jgi:hypothetical protein
MTDRKKRDDDEDLIDTALEIAIGVEILETIFDSPVESPVPDFSGGGGDFGGGGADGGW